MAQALVTIGQFCPNPACPDYEQVGQGNMVRFGHTPNGAQRYRCKTCGKTLTETKGTLFYRRRTPRPQILETLALLAEGIRISSLSRAKGFKEDTILDWLRQAAAYVERTHLTSRQMNGRLVRKTLGFSKAVDMFSAACIWEDVVYNFARSLNTLRLEVNDGCRRWLPRSPGVMAGITDHIWTVEELLTHVPIPLNN